MHYDLILKNGVIVTPTETFQGDIAVSSGKIAKTGTLEPSDTADVIYDASGKHILPGIIDAHVHFRDPGLTEKEDFETGSIAAAFGGVTMVADMPNVIPVTSTAEHFNEKAGIAKEKSYVDFALYALLNNDNSEEMEGLKKAGALGFKVFLGTSTGEIAPPSPDVLVQQMEKSAKLGMRIALHCESSEVNSNFTSVAKKETDSPDNFWLDYARPVLSELLAIKTVIQYAQSTNAGIHILHITSADAVLLAGEAKQEGIDITVETCPHYLFLAYSTEENDEQDGLEKKVHKVYPPIRDESNCGGLWEAIGNGTIDMVATDHAPHTVEEKSLPVWEAPGGLCGVETLVPLFLNEVNKGTLSLNDFVRLAAEMPAKIWGIYPQKGSLLPGTDADITVVDMNAKKTIRAEELHSKNKISPYDGMEVQGFPVSTIVRGQFVVKDGELTGKRGYGVLVSPV